MKRIFTSIQEQRNHEMNEAFTNLEKICNHYGFTIKDIKIVKIEVTKPREYSSPIIEELLNETTPEELERIDKSMENKKQTAVEWLQWAFEHTILTHEQIMQTIGLFEQAKEMEKEQRIKAQIEILMEIGNKGPNAPLYGILKTTLLKLQQNL